MTKRGKLRCFTFAAGLVLVLFGLWLDTGAMLETSRTQLEYSYRRALNDLTDSVSGLESTLEKAPYAGTAVMREQISAKLLEESGGAKAALAVLPLSPEKSDRFSRFLSQTGDYALCLARASAAGISQDSSDLETLDTLRKYAGRFSQALQTAQSRVAVEGISIGRVESLLDNLEADSVLPTLDDEFDEAAQAFSQFPALLYDGPFSDHIQRREPLFLKGREEISRETAAERAAGFLGRAVEDLTCHGQEGDRLPVYAFTCGDSRVTVTRQGGEVAYFRKTGEIGGASLSCEQAVERAYGFLEAMGFSGLQESYYVTNDNMCMVNFSAAASVEGEQVVCYPDLIKVTVELEQGGTVEYDAAGYLMNHRERGLSLPSLSRETAEESLSPLLTVDGAGLAVIPTPGLDEVLCWEFRCHSRDGQKKFLVYINGETGLEEQLYLLREDDHGTLVD